MAREYQHLFGVRFGGLIPSKMLGVSIAKDILANTDLWYDDDCRPLFGKLSAVLWAYSVDHY